MTAHLRLGIQPDIILIGYYQISILEVEDAGRRTLMPSIFRVQKLQGNFFRSEKYAHFFKNSLGPTRSF